MRGYTEEQMSWLAENAKGSTWQALTDGYNKRFNTGHSLQRLKTHCNRHGIHVTEPLNGKPCWNAKPIGHICPTGSGYARIKTENGYQMLARVNMPDSEKGKVCVHLNDDKMSSDVIYASKKAMRQYALLCRYNNGFRSDRATALKVCELDVAIKGANNGERH